MIKRMIAANRRRLIYFNLNRNNNIEADEEEFKNNNIENNNQLSENFKTENQNEIKNVLSF